MHQVRPTSIGEPAQTKPTKLLHHSDSDRHLSDARRGLTGIAIVDDEDSFRLALCTILDQSGTFRCVGSYGSGEEAVVGVSRVRPEVVLMDIRMAGISGIECMRQ